MEYIIKFEFNTINKRSMISGKSGEIEITTDANPEQLKNSDELIGLIAAEMQRKTKQSILSVDITDIIKK